MRIIEGLEKWASAGITVYSYLNRIITVIRLFGQYLIINKVNK